MWNTDPNRNEATAHYAKRIDEYLDQFDRATAAGFATPAEAAGMPWLPATAILANALSAERSDPEPIDR